MHLCNKEQTEKNKYLHSHLSLNKQSKKKKCAVATAGPTTGYRLACSSLLGLLSSWDGRVFEVFFFTDRKENNWQKDLLRSGSAAGRETRDGSREASPTEFLMDRHAPRPPEDPEIPLWRVGASEVANWKGIWRPLLITHLFSTWII